MGERYEWNIEEIKQIIRQLNQNGTLIKNAIAGIYNTFRYRIAPSWSGKNYNKVVDYVNGYAPEFKTMTEFLGVTVPNTIKEIANAQAIDGNGYGIDENFALASDNDNPDIWEVPHSAESADGAIRIQIEIVDQYVRGSQYPSVSAALDLAKQYFAQYLNAFQSNIGYFSDNLAVMDGYNKVLDYKATFEARAEEMIFAIVDAAEQEIRGIDDVNINTKQQASIAVEESSSVKESTSVGGNSSSGGSSSIGRNKSTDTDSKSAYVSSNSSSSSSVSNNSGSSWVNATTETRQKYDKSAGWNTLSSDNKVKRAYTECTAAQDQWNESDVQALKESYKGKLTDSEYKKLEDALSGDVTVQEYKDVTYDKTADWADLSKEQRVQKALDNKDYASRLTGSEVDAYSKAQYQLGEHVDYELKSGEIKISDLNSDQRVQWAYDNISDAVKSNTEGSANLNVSAYEEMAAKYLSVDELKILKDKLKYFGHIETNIGYDMDYSWALEDID